MTCVGPQVFGYCKGLSKGHTIEFSQSHRGLRISVYRQLTLGSVGLNEIQTYTTRK